MKIYLASLYSRRSEMELMADYLEEIGHEIVSRWVYGEEEGLTNEQISELDLEDVERADCVLSFTLPYGTYYRGGGRNVEFGYGLAMGKQCDIIGERENVFHWDRRVTVYPTINHWIAANPIRWSDEIRQGEITMGSSPT